MWEWRERFCFILAGAVCIWLTGGVSAVGQDANKSAPTPVSPGDLSKPVFDTTKPIYDSVPALEKSGNALVAEVEGRAVTLGEVADVIRSYPPAMAQYPLEVLYPGIADQLIRLQALVIRAQSEGLDEDQVVRRRTRDAAARALADEYVRRKAETQITEDALLARYKRDVEGKPGAEQVHARIIMVPTEKEAQSLIEELRNGADFATLARRSSKDPTLLTGGDLGFVTRDGLNAEVGSVAFSTLPGQVAPFPVFSVGSWFVVRVDERNKAPPPPYVLAREKLRKAWFAELGPEIARKAMEGLKVRQFDLTGKELGQDGRRLLDRSDENK